MAERRMFHRSIVESDSFLDMPISAQALYFHLGMHTDEDGSVNSPRKIARMVGASVDDLSLLIEKRFVLEFDGGVIVIKHWRMANSLKNDRIQPPRYPELAVRIYIKPCKAYTDHPAEGAETLLDYKKRLLGNRWNPDGFQTDSQQSIAEQSGNKHSRAVAEARGIQAGAGNSTGLSTETSDKVLQIVNGELGKGVIHLSNAQIESLLETIGIDFFDYYVEKLADFIISKGAKPKNHYETILSWWREDGKTR